ncbi:MAG: hypothetical protein MJZ16_12800 [Bacteroidales bacterium]|nr:hypothetical protein [Bacteroidales bacterium]
MAINNTKTSKRGTKSTVDIASIVESPAQEKAVAAPVVEKKKWESEELISCHSIVHGELVYQSKKSGILYDWQDYGDENEVEYQDLLPLYITKSPLLFKPYFVIDNPELLNEWTKLKDVYAKIYQYEDIDYVLDLDPESFRAALLTMPDGLKDSLKTAVATRIDSGEFDSLQKIKIMDQVLGTDLLCLVS